MLSLGHSLEIVKDLGDARRRCRRPLPAGRVHWDPRDRTCPDGDGIRRGRVRCTPVLGVSVLRRGRGAQRTADELLPVETAPRVQRGAVPVGVRLRDHRRVPGREDVRGRLPRGRHAQEPRGPRRGLHVHGGHEGRARRREGRDGSEAARPLRVRRVRRDGGRTKMDKSSGAQQGDRDHGPSTRGRCSCGHDERFEANHLRCPRPRGAERQDPEGLEHRKRRGELRRDGSDDARDQSRASLADLRAGGPRDVTVRDPGAKHSISIGTCSTVGEPVRGLAGLLRARPERRPGDRP